MGAIRGAICAQNTVENISSKSVELISAIMFENNLDKNDLSAIFFSVTSDLDVCYPAKSVREQLDLPQVAFMCFQEMAVGGSLSGCIRVCVFADKIAQKDCRHCYLGEASILRPDLNNVK